MRGVIRQNMRNDGGMTLVEILVAFVILFIILTGVLGLVGATTSMSLQAKQKNVLTNSLQGYVEWLHSLPFDEVETDVLMSEKYEQFHSFAVGEFTVVITPSVSPGENVYLKDVAITVTAQRADGETHEYSTMVVVRDRTQSLTEADNNPALRPTVEFIGFTPPEGSVVRGTKWINPGDASATAHSAYIQVRAVAAEGRTIADVSIKSGAYDLHSNVSLGEDVAVWLDLDGQEWTSPAGWIWNSAYMVADGAGELVMPFDRGIRRITVVVRDNQGQSGLNDLWYYLDNIPPEVPTLRGNYVIQRTTTGGPAGRGWRVTANLEATPPDPPTSEPIYTFFRVADGVLQVPHLYSGLSNSFTDVVEFRGASPTVSNFPATSYVAVVTYTPQGFDGGVEQEVETNTVSTAHQAADGTYEFVVDPW